MQAEPMNCTSWFLNGYFNELILVIVLVLRVLYRLRFLSEQAPFDVTTFSYIVPLLTQIFTKGAVGLTEEDDPLEQTALSLDVVNFHCGECE